MRTLICTFTIVAALGLSGVGTAIAQEELDKEKHSTIGEQLVPVGEHNKYEYVYKKNVVSINPLTILWGSYAVGYSRALSDNFAVRGDLAVIDGSNDIGVEIRATVPIFFKKMNDGFFLEPGLFWLNIGGISGGGPLVMLGWAWIWDSGFNVNLAAGSGRAYLGGDSDGDSVIYTDGMVPMGRLQFGYAF